MDALLGADPVSRRTGAWDGTPGEAGGPRRLLAGACLSLLLLLAAGPAQAQLATVRGRVIDADEDRPMEGVHVVLDDGEGQRVGTATDPGGYFNLGGLTPGTYALSATFLGFEPYVDTLALAFGDDRVVSIRLRPEAEELDEVVVETERADASARAAGLDQVRPSEVARVPIPGLSGDLAAYLSTLPGVVSTGDRGGQLFIRGGTPTQNLVLVDGMRVYQPFHIVGFYSVIPSDILAYADVYAGGFGARYGGRVASVIDVATRNGSKRRISGAATLAPFLNALWVEGPLVPGKISLVASARASALEQVAPGLLGRELPYRFGDLFVKTHAYLNRTSSVAATVLHAYDEGRIAGSAADAPFTKWLNQAVGARYTYLPADQPVMAQFALYGSRFQSRYQPVEVTPRRASVEGFQADINFAYLLGASQLHFGLFAGSTRFDYNLGGASGLFGDDVFGNVTEGGFFVEGRFRFDGRLHVEPGLRVQSFAHGVHAALEPRLRLRWQPDGPDGRQQFSAAGGLYHQQILGLSNQRDVTDAFVAWAPTPMNQPVPRAVHAIAGWDRRLGRSVNVSAEGYYMVLDHLRFPRATENVDRPGRLEQVDGTARGVDLRLELTRSWLYAHVGYGLAFVTYERVAEQVVARLEDGTVRLEPMRTVDRFSPPHDRRHQVNLMAQVDRGSYRLNVRWQYGSGLPFTQIGGYYDRVLPGSPEDAGFGDRRGETRVSLSQAYTARLPAYHRLDVTAERRFELRRRVRLTLQAGVINAYDRANIFSYDLLTQRRTDQLPLIPTLSLRVELR